MPFWVTEKPESVVVLFSGTLKRSFLLVSSTISATVVSVPEMIVNWLPSRFQVPLPKKSLRGSSKVVVCEPIVVVKTTV